MILHEHIQVLLLAVADARRELERCPDRHYSELLIALGGVEQAVKELELLTALSAD